MLLVWLSCFSTLIEPRFTKFSGAIVSLSPLIVVSLTSNLAGVICTVSANLVVLSLSYPPKWYVSFVPVSSTKYVPTGSPSTLTVLLDASVVTVVITASLTYHCPFTKTGFLDLFLIVYVACKVASPCGVVLSVSASYFLISIDPRLTWFSKVKSISR